MYLTANQMERLRYYHFPTQVPKARVKFEFWIFATIEIKVRAAGGNILTRYPYVKIQLKMEGVSTFRRFENIYYESNCR